MQAGLPGLPAKVPGSQPKHTPTVLVYPAGQGLHWELPGASEVKPAEHVAHCFAPAPENCETGQGAHCPPKLAEAVPGEQGEQAVPPGALVDVPGVQAVQVEAPDSDDTNPGSHSVQLVAPEAGWEKPGSQGVQPAAPGCAE